MQSESAVANPGLVRLFGQTEAGEAVSLTAIRGRASKQLTRFATLAQQQLGDRAITIPPALSLVSRPEGELELESQHPQADAIRAWLRGNSTIAKKFKEVEVLFEIVRAAEHPGVVFPEESCFHIGLTSAGPIAYFEDHSCTPGGH
ncbi:hypothetical protein [Pseudogulbenkiania sp. MAI-1]|uniref:hypothetical protein n=1 Tax=Pseudogulbenkiania sp. MAI-1 TaxID=990370 RepID=UPI00045EAB8A|nr:hypothetical protein [Pseudogulbenkiania sp. MAI-1]